MEVKIQIPTLAQFKDDINKIKQCVKFDLAVNKLARKYNLDFIETETSALAGVAVDYMDRVFKCEQPDSAVSGDIGYFCFELNFGEDWEPGTLVELDEDGNKVDIDLSSVDKLYEYLIWRLERNGEV